MDIELMREFCFLAEQRNALKTARTFHISPSTLSRHMSRLEDELGTPLFKSTRTYTLTPKGERAFTHFGTMLVEYDRLRGELASDDSQHLRIAYALEDRAVANAVMQGRKLFLKENPRARVTLVVPQEQSVLDSLEKGDADAGILYLPADLDESAFDHRLIIPDFLYAAVPRGTMGNQATTLPLQALEGLTFCYATKPGYQDYTNYILAAAENKGVRLGAKGIAADNIDELYGQDIPGRVWFFTSSSFSDENRPLFQQAYDASDLYRIADVSADRHLVYHRTADNYLISAFASCMERSLEL